MIAPLYTALLDEESRHGNKKTGMESGFQMVVDFLTEKHMEYDELVASF